jgi:hypothetical protein
MCHRSRIFFAIAIAAILVADLNALADPSSTGTANQKEVVVPSAPRAAQIEPMVAPVKRQAPETPTVKIKVEKVSATSGKSKKSAVAATSKRAPVRKKKR